MLLFSVVIPLYNKEDVIARALKSVANQTFRDFELIIVDDGSKDGSIEVVENFAKSDEWKSLGLPLRIFHQANAGASAARNKGASLASGRFLSMLDADDEWLPSHLSDLHDVYTRYPDAKVMSTAWASIDEGRAISRMRKSAGIGPYCIFDFPEGNYPLSSDTIAIERELFDKVNGYNTCLSYYEDRELYYRLAEEVGSFYANWKISAYYHHDACQSANKQKRHSFSEHGYLILADERIRSHQASQKMIFCVRKTVNNYIRGEIVRGRWSAFEDICVHFPCIREKLSLLNVIYRHRKLRGLLRMYYVLEWILVRGAERLAK